MKTNRWNWKPRSHRASEAGQSIVLIVLILGLFLLGASVGRPYPFTTGFGNF